LLRDEIPVETGVDPFRYIHEVSRARPALSIRDSLVGGDLRPSLAR
jgi:hypothetical protein